MADQPLQPAIDQPLLTTAVVPDTTTTAKPPADAATATACCCCQPTSRAFRALILALACTLTFGSYFSYDNPGALTESFKHRLCHNSTARYEWLYSIYSWPNTIQPFLGGYIIDNVLGVRRAAIIFCALIALGTAIVALSATLTFPHGSMMPFYIAIAGRFVFGLGGESLTVTQNTFVARWFSGRELATAFAICLSFSRIGSALNFAIEKPIENRFGFSYALWASAVMCVVSTVAGVVLSGLDNMGEQARVVGKHKRKYDEDGVEMVEGVDEGGAAEEEDDDANWRDVGKVLRCREVLMYGICMSFYVAVFVFITIASSFFQRKYALTPTQANHYVALPYTVSAIISPFLGFIIDSIGYSAQWVFLSSVSLALVHVCFATTALSPFPVMIWLGVTYSLCAASLWPMVAIIVDLKQLGTAYGLMTALQNLGLAVAPLVIGPLVENDDLGSYVTAEWIFAGCGALSAVLTLMLCVADASLGQGLLYASARKIRRVQAEKLKKERQHYRNYKRKKEREARMDRSGYGAVKQHDGSVLSSWQSTQESVTPGSAIESTGSPFGSPNGSTSSSVLFSPKTTFELRSTYFRRLDILLRRKGGLS